MMSKVLAALLAFVSMVANTPGYTPGAGARSLTADAPTTPDEVTNAPGAWAYLPAATAGVDDFDINEWLGRAVAELNSRHAAWSQLDLSTLDLSIGASDPIGDASRTLLASALFESPERIARLAALDPRVSNQFSGGFSRGGGATGSSVGSGQGAAGGSGPTGSDGNGSGGGSSVGEGGHDDGQDSKNDPSSETGPAEEPGITPPPPDTTPPTPDLTPTPPGITPPAPDLTPTPPGITPPAPDLTPPQPGVTPPVSVPEPASMGLLGLGLIGMSLARRRRAKGPRI